MFEQPKVLFVSNKDDFAIDFLIYKFKDYNIPYLRLNSEDITEYKITWSLGTVPLFCFKDHEYNLSNIKSVYFRRAPSIFPKSVNNFDTQFINGERRDFFEGLYLFLKAKWINPIFSTYMAEKKLYQLNTAKEIGFTVPETIISNNPQEIIEFCKKYGKCIIKPISHGLQVSKEGTFSIYTSEIKDIDFLETDKLFEAPVMVQSKINNYRDIRATVVGRNIFSVEIEKENNSCVDWRVPEIKKAYRIHKLPDHIENLIYKLHTKLDLVYSAFDFIQTPSGDYIFLETNPAGEWVWLERELGLPISISIVNELIQM